METNTPPTGVALRYVLLRDVVTNNEVTVKKGTVFAWCHEGPDGMFFAPEDQDMPVSQMYSLEQVRQKGWFSFIPPVFGSDTIPAMQNWYKELGFGVIRKVSGISKNSDGVLTVYVHITYQFHVKEMANMQTIHIPYRVTFKDNQIFKDYPRGHDIKELESMKDFVDYLTELEKE